MQDNTDQIDFWAGHAGRTWVGQQDAMDALLQPVLDGVMQRADLRAGQRVLDVGCGTGASTLAAARRIGPHGLVLGADVSDVMLAQARKRTAALSQVRFACADMAHHTVERPFDRLISRFGVMFFDDTRAAFANMARALRRGGEAHFATWGQIDQNPWFTLPARVGRDMFGPTPKSDPDGPGPFALRDTARTLHMLNDAGWSSAQVDVRGLALTLDGGAGAIADLCMHIGPAANTVAHFDLKAEDRAALKSALTAAFAELPDHAVPAQINFFSAIRS